MVHKYLDGSEADGSVSVVDREGGMEVRESIAWARCILEYSQAPHPRLAITYKSTF